MVGFYDHHHHGSARNRVLGLMTSSTQDNLHPRATRRSTDRSKGKVTEQEEAPSSDAPACASFPSAVYIKTSGCSASVPSTKSGHQTQIGELYGNLPLSSANWSRWDTLVFIVCLLSVVTLFADVTTGVSIGKGKTPVSLSTPSIFRKVRPRAGATGAGYSSLVKLVAEHCGIRR